jgi:hypothetical protein
VLTHKAPQDEAGPSIKFLSGDIRSAIGEARDAGGGKNVLVIGADVARQCIQEGLIDEIMVGDGVRFFNWPGAPDGFRLRRLTPCGPDKSLTFSSVSSNRFGASAGFRGPSRIKPASRIFGQSAKLHSS